MQFEWEKISEMYNGRYAHGHLTCRAKIKNGWLVSHALFDEHSSSSSLIFVDDPNHEWQIE